MGMEGTAMNMNMNMPQMDMPMTSNGMPGMGGSMPMAMGTPTQAPALTPSESAMMSTMVSMMAPTGAPLSGDPDRDYAIMMSQHHQAAIDMANVELKYGTYQPLLVLAKEIIAAQTEEIGEFRTILAKDYSTPMSATAVGGK
ncbi:hypothetical protein WJX75_003584 [Coccomyxa subellipsoidea]|uniref:DUF305 domain-containing protein n=1 Tax=Coccomyxa subellipsoidea TaxID=248742 RepID=A0ABR2YEU4_9CHLO